MQQFVETECCVCGIAFKVPRNYLAHRREDGEGFYCPNGHSLTFKKQSEVKQPDDELAKAREQRRLRRESE